MNTIEQLQDELESLGQENKALWKALLRNHYPSARGCGLTAEEIDERGGLAGMAKQSAIDEFKRCGGKLTKYSTLEEDR